MTKPKTGRALRRLAESEAVREYHLKRSTRRLPIVIKDLPEPRMVTLTPKQMAEIRVDSERYQRVRQVEEVNTLIHVLRSGGSIPDPVTLSRRPDGTLWVVDGQQRFWAYLETETPMRALIYEVPDIDAERTLFVVLNSTQHISANTKVHAWAGPVAAYLRQINDDKDSPFFGQINFGQHHSRPYPAMVMVKGVLSVMTGLSSFSAPANDLLRRADVAWQTDAAARDRARAFLLLLTRIFGRTEGGRSTAKALPVQALGLVAYDRWLRTRGVVQPSEHILHLLRRMNWDTIIPSQAGRFLPVLRSAIEQRWKI